MQRYEYALWRMPNCATVFLINSNLNFFTDKFKFRFFTEHSHKA